MREEKKEKGQKQKLEFEGTMELEKAITYLEEMLQSIKDGTVSVECGDQRVTLKPPPVVQFEFEAKTKQNKEALSIELKWMDGLAAAREDVGLKISSKEAESPSTEMSSEEVAGPVPMSVEHGGAEGILFRNFEI